MRTIEKILFFLVLVAAVALTKPAAAQEVTRMPEGKRHSVSLDGGLDGAFVVRAGYSYQLGIRSLPDATFTARFALPVVLPDLGDWGLDLGLRASVARWRSLRLAFQVGPTFRMNDNELFTAFAAGVSATMLAGFEAEHWGLSLETTYEQMLATYLRQSDLYRETYAEGAQSGWYALSGSRALLGLRGGGRIGPVELFAKAGVDATGLFHSITPPFYATGGVGFAF